VTAVTQDDREAFSAATFDAFDDAFLASAERQEEVLSLAGRAIRLRYVAPELATRFRSALRHLEPVAGTLDDLEVCCWDRSVTDIVPPAPPWSFDAYLARGRIRGLVDGAVRATFDPGARILCLYDRNRRAALMHVADARDVPQWMDRAPFRTILTWWATDRGLVLMHGAAVARGDSAVVLAGTSGAGKSTTALACFAAGMNFIGDDACLVSAAAEPIVHSVYRLAKLERDAARRFPSLSRLAAERNHEQTLVDPGLRHCSRVPLRTILLPSVTGATTTRLVPVSAGAAIRTLGPTSLAEGGGMVRNSLSTLVEVARNVPCFRLELGENLDEVVETVRSVVGDSR
jgi:hypothetical protein